MNGHYTAREKTPVRPMLDFVRLLKGRYHVILNHTRDRVPLKSLAGKNLGSLCLSEAFLEKGDLLRRQPDLPLQVAIIGPTQAGKSSLVNLLLGGPYAGVSPLAGFTTFPQGFALGLTETERIAIENFFHEYQLIEPTDIADNSGGIYSLRLLSQNEQPGLKNCVIWDTPDFDSIHFQEYYEGLLRTIALADVVILAVSKDKYGDQTVWNILSLLEALQQPLLLFLNKIAPGDSPAVIQSFNEKWEKVRKDPGPRIITAPFFNEGIGTVNGEGIREEIKTHLHQVEAAVNRNHHHRNCAVLLHRYWATWTEAVRQEQNLHLEWKQLLDAASNEAIEIYRRYYLNHPQHFETLKRALAELLTLLEIPGVAPFLMKTREVLTWPVRQLFGMGTRGSTDAEQEPEKSQELLVLERMFEHYMIELSNAVFAKRGESGDYEHWWNEIAELLKSENPRLAEAYNLAVRNYQRNFHQEIEETAHRLYSKLEQQPATLNSLRATRVTTDAAAVAIALKTGGIGVQDFVITPAVLSLTSFLTESALGQYMKRVETELKQKQLEAVSQQIFEEALNMQLKNLPAQMNPDNKFNIPEDSLRAAEAQLHAF